MKASIRIILSLLIVTIFNYGCSSGFSESPGGLVTNLNSEDEAPVEQPSSNFTIVGSSSADAKADCSRSGATAAVEIRNADSDIRLCAEYELDMPLFSARHDERKFCDTDSKFMTPDSEWTYNSSTRTWTVGTIHLSNHSYLVPGSYKVYAKEANGQIHRSDTIVIARPDYVDCKTATAKLNPPKLYVSTTGTGGWTLNGSVCKGSTLYAKITNVSNQNPPKGCTTAAGDDGCLDVVNHRTFTSSEWLDANTIQTGPINSGDYNAGTYETYLSIGETVVKIGSMVNQNCD